MKTYKLAVLIVLLSCFKITAQNNYSSFLIPKELTKNADAVVRFNKKTVDVLSVDKMIVKEKRIVTVFNKQGNTHINAYKHYNNDTRITKLSAVIYDASGKKVKKFSERDFKDVSAVSGGTLYSDSKLKYLEYTPSSYPYTVVFESEYNNSSTGFIPRWFPIDDYNLAIEKSVYIFNNPLNLPFQKRERNFTKTITKNSINTKNLSYTMLNQKAEKYEDYTVNFENFAPNLTISLDNFTLKRVRGEAKDWNKFGRWMYRSLIEGRNKLSAATVSKIKDLVKGIDDPIEKAKIVYKYVQDKTRYIGVQIDIGGWEPIASNKVDEVSYGDCKGLTNYTKALLDAVNVTSHHTIVYAKNNRDIDKNFTAIQGNHMILNIPNQGKDVWLECTSQTVPFGFLGDFTDDRDVLVITPEGGIIKRTPAYINNDNSQITKAEINLLPKEKTNASVEITSKGIQYDNKYYIENFTEKKVKNYYKTNTWDYINNLEIATVTHINDEENIVFTENLTVQIEDFGKVKDSSYVFKVNLFNRLTKIPKRYRNRKRSLKIDRGFWDKDEYTFKLPKGYLVTTLPKNKEIENKFGVYKMKLEKLDDITLKYSRELSIKKGIYPKEDYKLYRNFRKKIAKYDNLRIELIQIASKK